MELGGVGWQAGGQERGGIGGERIAQSGDVEFRAALFSMSEQDARLALQALRKIGPTALVSGGINPPAGESQQQECRQSEQERASTPRGGPTLVRLAPAEEAGFQLRAAGIEWRGTAGERLEGFRFFLLDGIQRVLKYAVQFAGRDTANEAGQDGLGSVSQHYFDFA